MLEMTRRYRAIDAASSTGSATLDEPRPERIRNPIRVFYGPDAPDYADYAENISEGGLFISTNRVFAVGTRLHVELRFPSRTWKLNGEVAWAIKIPEHERGNLVCGMGVQLVGGGPEWYAFFKRWKRNQDHSA